MGREEEHNIATVLFWKVLESSFDILGDSLDEAGMCTPSINDTPTDTGKKTGSALSINVIKTAARSTTAVLRICVKAIARSTPSSFIRLAVSSARGFA